MDEEEKQESYIQYHNAQSKYTYFLLAADAAIIGHAVQLTSDRSLSWNMIPLAFAVCLWILSFVFGCLNRRNVSSMLYVDVVKNDLNKFLHLVSGGVPYNEDSIDTGKQLLDRKIKKLLVKSNRYNNFQFYCLIGGAIPFLLWHIIEMIDRTIGYSFLKHFMMNIFSTMR